MATAHGSFQVRLVDYLGVETSKIFYFQTSDASTVAQIATDCASLMALLDPVTDAASAGTASLTINIAPSGLKVTPLKGNPLNTGILSTLNQVSLPNAFSDLVPAAAQAQISSGHVIDTVGSPYDSYITNFFSAMPHIQLESNIRVLLASLRHNDVNTRKRRKQQTLKTEEI
jgi:hypothetical protein